MTNPNPMPSQQRLRELFEYRDGALYRLTSTGGEVQGAKAGYKRPDGYYSVCIDRRHYRRHRVVYAYFYGDPGRLVIDHINGVKGDDRVENLRLATRRQNKYNVRCTVSNSSGYKGVSWSKYNSKWVAQIRLIDGRKKNLGFFVHKSDAIAAYRQAAIQIHGEFACFT